MSLSTRALIVQWYDNNVFIGAFDINNSNFDAIKEFMLEQAETAYPDLEFEMSPTHNCIVNKANNIPIIKWGIFEFSILLEFERTHAEKKRLSEEEIETMKKKKFIDDYCLQHSHKYLVDDCPRNKDVGYRNMVNDAVYLYGARFKN